jgi:glycosyltransferase involved in cell wall biosynthesis
MRRRRLLTVSHSYVVALNRRLAAEMAKVGGGEWEVTALAPERFHGDLRRIELERRSGEPNGLESVPAYATRSAHLFFYGPSLARTLRAGWDCVHLWEEPYVFAGLEVAACLPPRTPLVFVTYQNIRKRYPPPFRHFERWVVRRSSGWIAGGQTVARALGASDGYRDRPSTTIPLGVDVDAFRADASIRREALRRLEWAEGGPPVIGYLGRLVPEKGVAFLLSVLDRTPGAWRALIVGGGSLDAEVRAWGARHGDRVRIVPAVMHDEVPLYLNAMDILCAPSQTTVQWREQLGRMIIEAFACGVAVLGSDSGEIPFTIGDAGLVLPEGDELAWIGALGEAVESPVRRTELMARGRQRAATHFAWPVVAERTLRFLEASTATGRGLG